MPDINLSASVRSNLSSLQNTATLMAKTQTRLSTGNKVNSALDNPTNFFTASSLNSRASDLNNLMDSMANGIKTIEAADNGLKAITKTVETMQSLVRQARADKTGAAAGDTAAAAAGDITPSAAVEATKAASAATGGKITFTVGGADIEIEAYDSVGGASLTDQQLADAINLKAELDGKVKADVNADGFLTLQNLTGDDIAVTGFSAANGADGLAATGVTLDKGTAADADDGDAGAGGTESDVRKSLRLQFNDLRDQLDRLAADASFNGINLLDGDELKLDFNESGTSSTTVQGKKADGTKFGSLTSASLKFDEQTDFANDKTLDDLSKTLQTGLTTLRSQASQYGSALSLVQNRQDFTKSMINTLETGAGNLTLADMNQEAANMMALQTRQSLASSTLSMANQADQSILQLLR